jgi:hypothetical protein
MLLVHTLSHCATIQLHEPLTNTNIGSRTKTLVAARAVVDIHARTEMIPKPMLGLLEPAVAVSYTYISQRVSTVSRSRTSGTAAVDDDLPCVYRRD